MNAIIYNNYGSPDVLRLSEVPKPQPNPGEILICIRAAMVREVSFCRIKYPHERHPVDLLPIP